MAGGTSMWSVPVGKAVWACVCWAPAGREHRPA
jgi:hypothetical protein